MLLSLAADLKGIGIITGQMFRVKRRDLDKQVPATFFTFKLQVRSQQADACSRSDLKVPNQEVFFGPAGNDDVKIISLTGKEGFPDGVSRLGIHGLLQDVVGR